MKLKCLLVGIAVFTASLAPATPPTASQSDDRPVINWEHIKNPIYSHADWSVKDAALAYRNGWFYLFFSAFFYDAGRERSHVVSVRTKDFKTYSEPLFIWSGLEMGWEGAASPDIVKHGDTYYLTFNTWGDKPGKVNQLFYATSQDLEEWQTFLPLAANATEGVRSIDAAIAFANGKVYLTYKRQQIAQIVVADSIDSKNWKTVGRPMGERWMENSQFVKMDSWWYLFSTQQKFDHEPFLCKMQADGTADAHWLDYETPQKCVIPREVFNHFEGANAASFYDFRKYDGYYYIIYAGTTEGISHAGRGDNKLGLARSKDLVTWEIP